MELVREFAEPFAGEVVMELVRVPPDDREGFLAWLRDAAGVRGDLEPEVWVELAGYLGVLAGWHGEVVVSAVEVVAGYARVVDLVADGLLALLGAPEQLAVLRREPVVLAGLVREVLRGDGEAAGNLGVAGVVAEQAVRAVLRVPVHLGCDDEELRWRARSGIRELRSVPVVFTATG
ncbi:hypothetical protein JOF53_001697 [Crossiella equi]|uniref:Uncharacterized protein n=1 Tax=Crossiella equi TaxID=130796 RepID=A0ABS5AAS7_9PSEU|nr:hypothetical protein [Crossiella equi]MBP2472825.1 hypothetical protein [Crossiella equi]